VMPSRCCLMERSKRGVTIASCVVVIRLRSSDEAGGAWEAHQAALVYMYNGKPTRVGWGRG
jgi:hypothetical protein